MCTRVQERRPRPLGPRIKITKAGHLRARGRALMRPRLISASVSYRRAYEVTCVIQGKAVRERMRSGVSTFQASQQASRMAS